MLHSPSRTMSKGLLAGLLVMSVALHAQEQEQAPADSNPPAGTLVYKSVNKEGQAVFTDMPPLDRPSDAVTVKPSNTISLPRGEVSQNREESAERGYTSLVITSPQNDEYFGQDVESVTLTAGLAPGLRDGHKIRFYYDGNPVGGRGLSYTIGNLERGTHTAQVKVLDEQDQVVIESELVKFHVRRISLLNQPSQPAGNDGAVPPSGFGGAKGFGSAGGAGGGAAAGSTKGAGGIGGAAPTPRR